MNEHDDAEHPSSLSQVAPGVWECSICSRRVRDEDAIVGQWECLACPWKGVVWVACSRRCAIIIGRELAPAMRGTKGGGA